jgi:hypothetical protein
MATATHKASATRREVLKIIEESRWAFLNVSELVCATRLPQTEITRLRKLAATSPADDPWRGGYVQIDAFLDWHNGRRRELEHDHPEI